MRKLHGNVRRAALLPVCFLLLLGGILTARAATPIKEWQVPWTDTRPRDPYVAPDGTVWFCGQAGGYLGRFNPATAEFKRFDLDEEKAPHNLIVAMDGNVWYAGNTTGHIGRLDPRTGEVRKFPMPDRRAQDPHTLTWGPDGSIWFTVQGGNFVGRLFPSSGEVRLIEVPTPGARPYGIVVDNAGVAWVVLFGTNKLAKVDPESMQLTEIPLPRESARPRRVGLTSDGTVWYADYAGGRLGAYTPAGGRFMEWMLPGGERAKPYALAVDDDDRVWVVETGLRPNRMVGFDPRDGRFIAAHAVPSGGGTVRHMYFHRGSGTIWFGTDTNYLGRFETP